MDEVHRRLAQRIRLFSEYRGVTLTHVPDRAGLGQSQFWSVMSGEKSPTLRWIVRIAAVFEIDAGELLAPELKTVEGENHARRDADAPPRSRKKIKRRR